MLEPEAIPEPAPTGAGFVVCAENASLPASRYSKALCQARLWQVPGRGDNVPVIDGLLAETPIQHNPWTDS